MEYIKRGEVPPELRTKYANARKVEVNTELTIFPSNFALSR